MSHLPMPSEVKMGGAAEAAPPAETPLVEPPSAKLLVRLFLIPLFIVTIAVGIMFAIGRLAGSTPTFDEALTRLKNPGGQRTVDLLIGPGSKQRYMDAKTLVDQMKSGMSAAQRIKLSESLIDILEHHTTDSEGEVRHFLLLALGRAWQIDPSQKENASDPDVGVARKGAVDTLLKYAESSDVSNRKAAVLALGYLAGQPESRPAIGPIVAKLENGQEDFDVRLSAATVLGPLATPQDQNVLDALHRATDDTDPAHRELVWSASLSLAQLNQSDVAPTILMLLDRNELSNFEVLDREADPKNPTYRKLSDLEQQRYLINTMMGAAKLQAPEIQKRLAQLRDNDPSPRVREAAQEILGR